MAGATVFDVTGAQTGGAINATGDGSLGCQTVIVGVGFHFISFAGSYHNDNVIPSLVPTFISHIPNDPAGKVACFLYASNGTDYKLSEVGVMANTNIGSGNTLYDSTLVGTSYSSNSITLSTPGASNWILKNGEAGVAAP